MNRQDLVRQMIASSTILILSALYYVLVLLDHPRLGLLLLGAALYILVGLLIGLGARTGEQLRGRVEKVSSVILAILPYLGAAAGLAILYHYLMQEIPVRELALTQGYGLLVGVSAVIYYHYFKKRHQSNG